MKVSFQERKESTSKTTVVFEGAADFAAFLSEQAKRVANGKEDVMLFTGAVWPEDDAFLNRDDGKGLKLQEDIVEIHALVYDLDGSTVPWQTVSSIFEEYEHIIYSSWSNGRKGTGERFRVVIPFSAPLTTNAVNIYHHLWEFLSLPMMSDEIGVYEKAYQLDEGKRSAQSWFFLPSLTGNDIWHHHVAPVLDPMALAYSPASIELVEFRNDLAKEAEANQARLAALKPKGSSTLSAAQVQARAAKALAKWATPDEGNANFFSYAYALKGHGIDKATIAILLQQNANQFGKNTVDRLKDIERILKQL
ncbi:hypothetical protein RMR21_009505 [Agrobacterium sp. rho-8.1]|nr:hypothetical protein [Agrobacterium sp. rho-8.1]